MPGAVTNIDRAAYTDETDQFDKQWRHLDLSGDHLGVRIEELEPGGTSSFHHYHTSEEEHVIALAGSATLHLGHSQLPMSKGDHICFKAGEEVPHHIENTSGSAFRFLVFGERKEDDVVFYPELNSSTPDRLALRVDDTVSLRSFEIADAEELFNLVEMNRTHLRAWLPWLDFNQSVKDSEAFIRDATEDAAAGRSLTLAIRQSIQKDNQLIGVIGFNSIDQSNDMAEIGYWLSHHHQGTGTVTKSVKALIQYGANTLKIKRFQISVGTENVKSQRIPLRLGFEKTELVKNAEWLYDHYVDHVRYVYAPRVENSP